MSISTTDPEPKDEQFADVVYTTDEPKTEETPAAPAPEEPETKEEKATPETKEEKEAPAEPKKPTSKAAIIIDVLIVLMLVLIMGGGGYFIKTQMDKYAVPSAYEEACAEYDRLKAELDKIISNKQQVNTVEKVKRLQVQIEQVQAQLAEAREHLAKAQAQKNDIQAKINEVKQGIDSARYNLREADRDFRAKALAELPGMPVGDVLNRRRNHIVKNAIIAELNMRANKIQLRSSSDIVNWNIRDISKKELPPIVRYALGTADLVDMSVLDEEGKEPARKRPVARREQPAAAPTAPEPAEESFDPAPGAPVISSGKAETITTDPAATPGDAPADTPTWDAPTGALPI